MSPRLKTIRPALLPDNRKVVYYPVIVGLLVLIAGILINNHVLVVLPLIVLGAFPGLSILFHAIYYLFVMIEVFDDRLVIKDHLGDKIVRLQRRSEIRFDDIDCVFYLEKEINLLSSFLGRLGKYNVPTSETDFSRESLVQKYGVSRDAIAEFESDSLKGLTDYAAAGISLKLDEIYSRHKVSRETRKTIRDAMNDDSNWNFEYIREALSQYPVGESEWEDLKDEFAEINPDILTPFLRTRLDLGKYMTLDRNPRTAISLARKNNALVLSSKDGTRKVYIMHFHDLGERDLKDLVAILRDRNPKTRFLMSKARVKRLFD